MLTSGYRLQILDDRKNEWQLQSVLIIGFWFGSVFSLRSVDNANNSRFKEATDMGRGVHEDKDVERISILAKRSGDKTEVEGEHHSLRQEPSQLKEL